MGSWYGTCGVSQLPILEDDEVMVFILEKNKTMRNGGQVHSWDLYYPICMPFQGTYDDYGRLDNLVDLDSITENHLKTIEIYSDGKEYVIEDLKSFIKDIERDKIDNFGIMMVHKDLYENLISYIANTQDYYTDGKSLSECFYKEGLELLEIMKKNDLRHEDFITKDLKNFKFAHDKRILSNKFKWKTKEFLAYYRNPSLYSNNKNYDNFIKFLLFIEIMENSRKLWLPQAGSGSQDREYEYAQIIGEFAKNKEEEIMMEW